ncbi:MAG: hypothetical protein ACI4W6_02120 [Acutalibacteraceae bacterium]
MSESNSDFYSSVNKNGFLCTYDLKTHKCIDILLCTGMDIERWEQECKEYIGKTDPKYSNKK